ncbi:UNVERIFIED_CONTAM: hypothetical protein NCL1_44979 [Trichonephila clavipes]
MAAAAMVVVAVGWCGRRCSFCLGSALGGALTLSIAIIQAGTTSRLSMFVVAKLSISSSSVVLPLWTSELLPLVVRSVGMRMTDLIGLVGPIALPFLFNQVNCILDWCYIFKTYMEKNAHKKLIEAINCKK